MSCYKTLDFEPAACLLATGEDKPQVQTVGEYVYEDGMGYAPDYCYCLIITTITGNETYWKKYEPATNSLVLKATTPWGTSYDMTYDATHKLFVCSTGVGVTSRILTFDPVTETTDSFLTGVTGWVGDLFYVPEKGFCYGNIGEDGTGRHYVGYVDLDLRVVVQLGVIPNYGGSTPFGYNLTYSPVSNCIYGAWITGLGAGLLRFDLATNTGTHLFTGLGTWGAIDCCWDSDRELLICCGSGGFVYEVNTATDTISLTTNISSATIYSFAWRPFYVSSLHKVVATGHNQDGDHCVMTYDTLDQSAQIVFSDYEYWTVQQLVDGSFMSNAEDPVENGIRRIFVL